MACRCIMIVGSAPRVPTVPRPSSTLPRVWSRTCMPTLQEIARLSNVSRSTVSRVIN
ncbi:MAG: LacI family transcriptional regulator, partial [Dehalococcoidia bacterium]